MTQHPDFHIRSIHHYRDFKPLQLAWDTLLAYCADASIFQTWTWHDCWLQAFTPPVDLWVLTVWQQQRLLAIAPLYRDSQKVLHFIGTSADKSQVTDYGDFICHPAYPQLLALLLAELWRQKQHWTELRLHNFRQHSPHYVALIQYLTQQKIPYLKLFLYDAPCRLLGDKTADEQLINKKRFRYLNNYFNRQGVLSYHHLTEADQIRAQLNDFFSQHQRRWQATSTPSKFNRPQYRLFFKLLVEKFAVINGIHLSFLTLDDVAIAYDFSLYYRQQYLYYTPSYHLDYGKKPPGLLLHQHLLKHLIQQDCRVLDYSIGSEAYKYPLSNKIEKIHQLRIFSHQPHYFYQQQRKRLQQWLYRHPRLHRGLCKLRGLE